MFSNPHRSHLHAHSGLGPTSLFENYSVSHDTLTSSIRASDTLKYYTYHAQKPFFWIVGSIVFNIAPALPFSPNPSMPWMLPTVWYIGLVSGLFAFYPNEHRHPSGLITARGSSQVLAAPLDPCSRSSMGWELRLISTVVMLLLLARGNISLNPDMSQPCCMTGHRIQQSVRSR